MSDLLAFRIYRTETVVINDEAFTVHLTERNDGEAFAVHVLNQSGSRNIRGSFTKAAVGELSALQGKKLADEVCKILGP